MGTGRKPSINGAATNVIIIYNIPCFIIKAGPGGNSAHLQYEIYVYDSGSLKLQTYLSRTLNFHNTTTRLRYAISIDNDQPQIVSINKEDNNIRTWEGWVSNNIIIKTPTIHCRNQESILLDTGWWTQA
ncbi:MAG: hypothetical protein ABIN67_14215 [Ferruginibacter sp.]